MLYLIYKKVKYSEKTSNTSYSRIVNNAKLFASWGGFAAGFFYVIMLTVLPHTDGVVNYVLLAKRGTMVTLDVPVNVITLVSGGVVIVVILASIVCFLLMKIKSVKVLLISATLSAFLTTIFIGISSFAVFDIYSATDISRTQSLLVSILSVIAAVYAIVLLLTTEQFIKEKRALKTSH